ncbi:MAG: hypothetical protein ACKVP7_27430 [Hyphomicrobiaceae bacterium]
MNNNWPNEIEHQYEKAAELYYSDKYADALALLEPLATIGYPPAFYIMASYQYNYGDREIAKAWLARLEAAAAKPDAQACFLCHHAFRVGWSGGDFETYERIGSDYLRRAAELGHDHAQFMLAMEHQSGANGQAKDESLFQHWITKAVDAGNEDAIYHYVKYLANKRRPIPPDLIADMEALAKDYPNAAKLLARIKRNPR